MSHTLLGIGECMVELSQADGGLLRQSFAGDVFNSLWYARAGLPASWTVSFCTGVGTDPTSDKMVAFIEGAGVDCGHVRRISNRRPGLYMIHLDGAERSFSYWRDTSAARLLAQDRAHLDAALASADVIYLSGITLAILPPEDAQALIEKLAQARAQGKTVAFDSNIRPALWSDAEYMRKTIGDAAGASSLVFPSFDDEQAAFGDTTPQATLERYTGYGAQTVILKNGPAEVCTFDQMQRVDIPTPPVATPVDTTGAGDSFNGAFLASYVQTQTVGEAVAAGQACAGQVIQHHGALVDL